MGLGNKALLKTPEGDTLLEFTFTKLSRSFANLALAGRPTEAALNPQIKVLEDATEGAGPLSGVLAGLEWCQKDGLAGIVSLPVDLPFVSSAWLEALCPDQEKDLETVSRYLVAQPIEDVQTLGHRFEAPLCAYWPASQSDALRDFLLSGSRSVFAFHRFIDSQLVDVSEIDPQSDLSRGFFNVNTSEDYARMLDMWR